MEAALAGKPGWGTHSGSIGLEETGPDERMRRTEQSGDVTSPIDL